jgi:hypothetical protein
MSDMLSKKFDGVEYGFAWSWKSKKKAKVFADYMRDHGIKARIVPWESSLWAVYLCKKDSQSKEWYSWKQIKGRAYAMAERA